MLVDYSKRRAEIGSPDESHTSFSWNSEVEGHHESFACDFVPPQEEEKNSSLRTLSTASVESSSSNLSSSDDLEISSHVTSEAPVSFRIKRSSMSHTAAAAAAGGAETSALPAGPGDAASSSARFHDSLPTDWKIMNNSNSSTNSASTTATATNTAPVNKIPLSTELNMKLPKPAAYRRNATSPARINSGDSLHCRLQYSAWKKKQKSLLSASAVIATSSDRDLFQHSRRRSSSSKVNLLIKEGEEQEAGVSPMGTSKPKIGRYGSHHNLGYGLMVEGSNSKRSSSRRRRVTMSHVNNPPPSSLETTIPVPEPQDLGYGQEEPASTTRSTRSSRRRSSASHSSTRGCEAVPALEGLPSCSSDLLGYEDEPEPQPEPATITPKPRYSRRRVTMTHVNHPPECDIPGPPALEPRRTCEMDALQALCGRRGGGSFHSKMSTRRGMDAPNKPPSPKYSRRRVSMSHVNNPPPTTEPNVIHALKRTSTSPVRISEVSIRSNSEHSRRRPRRKTSIMKNEQRNSLQNSSFHGGSSSSSLSRTLSTGYKRQGTPPQATGPLLTRRHTRDITTSYSSSRGGGRGAGRPTLADNGKSQSFRGAQRASSSSGARVVRRTSSSILMASSSLGYRRQGTPPQEVMSSSSSFRNAGASSRHSGGGGRSLLLSSSSFHGSRRNNNGSSGSLRDASDNSHQEQAPSPPRRSTSRRVSMANFGTTTASSSGNNLNDFVTGSRIRRLA